MTGNQKKLLLLGGLLIGCYFWSKQKQKRQIALRRNEEIQSRRTYEQNKQIGDLSQENAHLQQELFAAQTVSPPHPQGPTSPGMVGDFLNWIDQQSAPIFQSPPPPIPPPVPEPEPEESNYVGVGGRKLNI